MNAILAVLALFTFSAIALFVPEYGTPAVLVGAVLALVAAAFIARIKEDSEFLLRLFIAGLLVRVLLGTVIYLFDLQMFFGEDYSTYDNWGYATLKLWEGEIQFKAEMDRVSLGSGWGMNYMVAVVYAVIGRNTLAIQYINAVLGAATAPVIFLCALHMFRSTRVARIAGLFVAFYPSLVLWSSQGLKDGPIVFLLALSMFATLKVGERLSAKYIAALVIGLFGIFSMRFYIFYMVVTAITGSIVIGMGSNTKRNLVREVVIVIAVGLVLTYMGVLRGATEQFEMFGSLETVQRSRSDLAQSAQSGFGQDADVSTVSGALTAIPAGATHLLFAPFPWQMANLRQSITLPEMLIWWGSFPLLVLGLVFTARYRLRPALPILFFTSMLTLSYSVMQGNIGTAYRQRSQLLVFYFIFVAVGFVLLKERAESRRERERTNKQKAMAHTRGPKVDDARTAYWSYLADKLSRKIGF